MFLIFVVLRLLVVRISYARDPRCVQTSTLQDAVARQGRAFASITDSVDPSAPMLSLAKRVSSSLPIGAQQTLSAKTILHQDDSAAGENNTLDPCTVRL